MEPSRFPYNEIDYTANEPPRQRSLWVIFACLFAIMLFFVLATAIACRADGHCYGRVPTIDSLLGERFDDYEKIGSNTTLCAPLSSHYLVATLVSALGCHGVLVVGTAVKTEHRWMARLQAAVYLLLTMAVCVNMAISIWYSTLVVVLLFLIWGLIALCAIKQDTFTTKIAFVAYTAYVVAAAAYIAAHTIDSVKPMLIVGAEVTLGATVFLFMILLAMHLGDIQWTIGRRISYDIQ